MPYCPWKALDSKLRNVTYGAGSRVADTDPHCFCKLDPDPHYFCKLDPDPHQSKKLYPDLH